MKEWKLRQKIFNQLHDDFEDSFEGHEIVEEYDRDSIIKRALEYIQEQQECYFYPGKSYAVAIIYALKLQNHFQEDFYEALDDTDLLYGLDPYFRPYSEAKDVYDEIISKMPKDIVDSPQNYSENMQKTVEYFEKEFLIHDETKIFASI